MTPAISFESIATFIAMRAPPDSPAVYTRFILIENRWTMSDPIMAAAFRLISGGPLRALFDPATM